MGGPFFSDTLLSFCKTRPVGTTAIFKYNHISHEMQEISTKYDNVSADEDKQPACCPHGSWSAIADCHAKSMASGDFDNDLISDQIILYQTKMVFYYSSDREKGELPYGSKFISSEVTFPTSCDAAESVRVVDFDLDGIEEILVTCNTLPFLLYRKKIGERIWTLDQECSKEGSLGDLVDKSLITFTEDDLEELCKQGIEFWKKVISNVCPLWLDNGIIKQPSIAGITLNDLNNDGFLDAVVTYDIGYLRFFHNIPSEDSMFNRYIVLKLLSENNVVTNIYGIGSTVVLYSTLMNGETFKQFKEVSTYQHATDKYGQKEDRIIFGLGKDRVPLELNVQWPNGSKQLVSLEGKWSPNKQSKVILISAEFSLPTLDPSIIPAVIPSIIPSIIPSEILSPLPTEELTQIQSAAPTYILSGSPSKTPSTLSSQTPTDKLTRPSLLPTSSPTMSSPTTSCVNATDNDNIKFDVNYSSTKFKGCKWLRNHPANIAEFCEVGKGAYLNCKETCCKLTCDNCVNPTGSPTTCVDLKQSEIKFDYTRFKSDGVTVKKEKTGKKCRNLAKESGANIEESCDNDMVNEGLTVANYCKATCDNCGDDSAASSISVTEPKCDATDNDNIKFDVNHSSKKDKGCKWLRNHLSKIAECCEVGKGAYLNCKKTCESCD